MRGYNRRHRDLWYASRWQTYLLMETQVGSKELATHGIRGPVDLMPLPWDSDGHMPERLSDSDIAELQAEIDAINGNHKKKG